MITTKCNVFLKGDKVRCVSVPNHQKALLTIGEVYTIRKCFTILDWDEAYDLDCIELEELFDAEYPDEIGMQFDSDVKNFELVK